MPGASLCRRQLTAVGAMRRRLLASLHYELERLVKLEPPGYLAAEYQREVEALQTARDALARRQAEAEAMARERAEREQWR